MKSSVGNQSNVLRKRLSAIRSLFEQDERLLGELNWEIEDLPARTEFVRKGDRPKKCCMVLQGIVSRSNFTRDGARQIQSIHIPGDIPDLMSLHLRQMDHFIGTVSPCRLAYVQHEDMQRVCAQSPSLNAALWRETLIDAALGRAAILRNSKLGALERSAHLICELHMRFNAVDLVQASGFPFPVTQELIGEVLGLTNVSVNRAIKTLRTDNLVTVDKSYVKVMDWARLADLGQFDASFLHLRDG